MTRLATRFLSLGASKSEPAPGEWPPDAWGCPKVAMAGPPFIRELR